MGYTSLREQETGKQPSRCCRAQRPCSQPSSQDTCASQGAEVTTVQRLGHPRSAQWGGGESCHPSAHTSGCLLLSFPQLSSAHLGMRACISGCLHRPAYTHTVHLYAYACVNRWLHPPSTPTCVPGRSVWKSHHLDMDPDSDHTWDQGERSDAHGAFPQQFG